MSDRLEGLRRAAQARHDAALNQVEEVLHSLAQGSVRVTFSSVAEAAGVSRSWLYRQPGIRTEIERLRRPRSSRGRPVAHSQRATIDSVRQQLHTCREELSRLRAENQVLKDQLARQLGAARAASVISRSPSR